jgi:hypothetical protein
VQSLFGLGQTGLELQRAAQVSDGLFILSFSKCKCAQSIVHLCALRTELNGPGQVLASLDASALLSEDDSQVVVGFGSIRGVLKCLAVIGDGVFSPPLT